MKKAYAALIVLALLACENKDIFQPIHPDSFSFGLAAGYCSGDCAKFFLVKDGNLFADEMHQYSGYGYGTLAFQTSPQSYRNYLLAKQLLDSFPEYLTNNPNKTFGCPNCYDQGQIDVTMNIGEKTNFWNIDTTENSVPIEIRSYLRQLKSILGQL